MPTTVSLHAHTCIYLSDRSDLEHRHSKCSLQLNPTMIGRNATPAVDVKEPLDECESGDDTIDEGTYADVARAVESGNDEEGCRERPERVQQ